MCGHADFDPAANTAGRLTRATVEKVDHAQRVNDPARPGGGFASDQRRRAFPTERRRHLAAELRVLVIQVSLAKGISGLGDFVEFSQRLIRLLQQVDFFRYHTATVSALAFLCKPFSIPEQLPLRLLHYLSVILKERRRDSIR